MISLKFPKFFFTYIAVSVLGIDLKDLDNIPKKINSVVFQLFLSKIPQCSECMWHFDMDFTNFVKNKRIFQKIKHMSLFWTFTLILALIVIKIKQCGLSMSLKSEPYKIRVYVALRHGLHRLCQIKRSFKKSNICCHLGH